MCCLFTTSGCVPYQCILRVFRHNSAVQVQGQGQPQQQRQQGNMVVSRVQVMMPGATPGTWQEVYSGGGGGYAQQLATCCLVGRRGL